RNHQADEAAAAVLLDAGVNQRLGVLDEPLHALDVLKVGDDGLIFPGEGFVLLLAAGVGQGAGIEDEASTVAAVVFRHAAVEGEAVNADDESLYGNSGRRRLGRRSYGIEFLEFFR